MEKQIKREEFTYFFHYNLYERNVAKFLSFTRLFNSHLRCDVRLKQEQEMYN